MYFKSVSTVVIVFAFRTSSGKEFRNRGAAMLNACGAHAIFVIGTTSTILFEDLKDLAGM